MLPKFDSKFNKETVFETIQEEHKLWSEHNFPGRESWVPLMGLGEELGELAEASFIENIKDAIGDCYIYLADYCNAMGYNLQEIRNRESTKIHSYRDLMANYGRLCHAHLKKAQNIRMNEYHDENAKDAIARITSHFDSYTKGIEEIVWEVWVKVRTRDWKVNRNSAHEQEERK